MTVHDPHPATLPQRRTQVTLRRPGGPDVLTVETAPMPTPGDGELLVRMQAAGVAFGDVTQRQGRNPGRLPPVLGYDVVGVVAATGPGTTGFLVGQRVAALTMTGGYASHVVVPARWTVPVPEHLGAAEISALTLNYLTAWQMLHRAARVSAGQSILVLGAAGGVGSALSELGLLAGVRVYGTASTRRHHDLRERGVEVVADASAVPEHVDATFDSVGGPSIARSRRATKRTGVVVAFGFSFTLDHGASRLGGLLRAVLAIVRARVTPGPRLVNFLIGSSADRDPAALRADLSHLVGLLADGNLRPRVETLPLSQAVEAHRRLENRQVEGKLVLVADQPV